MPKSATIDVDLCTRALRLHPELWQAVQIVARTRGKGKFPIKSLEDLVAALSDQGTSECRLENVTLTQDQATKYFPAAFLPIIDEDDLLKKLFAALAAGSQVHVLEAQLAKHKRGLRRQKSRKGTDATA